LKFAREGYFVAAVPALAAVLSWAIWGPAAAAIPALLAVGVLLFFRDPERTPEGYDASVIAPADGKVVAVEDLPVGHLLADEAKHRIAIFMSPLNVHVNRSPVSAEVDAVKHRRGSFRAAYSAEASDVNESNAILLNSSDGFRLVVVQIAGWMARRIVCRVHRGSRLLRGERLGLIMFGSRVDVYLPEQVRATVVPGDRVRAGASVIAQVKVSR